ncbi:MAG TPA: hypothetical protein PLW93_04575, partial [Candidatus Absconditabacterales bacterium]|nr:hypothetical protein [Candidatus Absconditabacterales bacterium]
MSTHQNYIVSYTKQIIKDMWFQIIGISVLIGFLLYLLHLLVGVTLGVRSMSTTIQNKLGVYYYIKDSSTQKDQIYSRVIEMKDKLEKLGMKVQYMSKEDAIKSIERKVPSVLDSFQKYGIENPLPATVYVLFNNTQDYEKLKAVVTLYEDIITNRDDISKIGQTMKAQEKRILTTLSMTKMIVVLSVILVVILVVIICSFLILTIKSIFTHFRKSITIQQLLGTPYRLLKSPFLVVSCLMSLVGFILSLMLRGISALIINRYTTALFDQSLFSILGLTSTTSALRQGGEIIIIISIALVLGNIYL